MWQGKFFGRAISKDEGRRSVVGETKSKNWGSRSLSMNFRSNKKYVAPA